MIGLLFAAMGFSYALATNPGVGNRLGQLRPVLVALAGLDFGVALEHAPPRHLPKLLDGFLLPFDAQARVTLLLG